ncbi:MAG: creatininase family protein [Deltaproteobacteria bacterium]|nr:creatininase family protein [Deltaproteobacteria bacterium]
MLDPFDLPQREARALCARGVPVYLTVNPVEYHGPHLSLHNDRLVSRGIVRELHAALTPSGEDWPLLLGADLEAGFEALPGQGSRQTSYARLRELVQSACEGLARLGAQRVVLMTFHGAPLQSVALQHGVRWLGRQGIAAVAPLNFLFQELLALESPEQHALAVAHLSDPALRQLVLAELRTDLHAGFFETSLALHYAPESVSPVHRTLPPCPAVTPDPLLTRASRLASRLGRARLARELELAAFGRGWTSVRPFYGYTGRPDCASPEAGAYFAAHIAALLSRGVRAVFDGSAPPPEPVLGWMRFATLGGRIPGLAVAEEALHRFP